MKARVTTIYRMRKTMSQNETERHHSNVLLEIPSKRMLLTLSPTEALELYQALDEEYTKVGGKREIKVMCPRIDSYTEVTNMNMLMGNPISDADTESAEIADIMEVDENGRVYFKDETAFCKFVRCIERLIRKEVQAEVRIQK